MPKNIILESPIAFLKRYPQFEKKLGLSSDYAIVKATELDYIQTLFVLNPPLIKDVITGYAMVGAKFSEKYLCKECGAEAMVSTEGVITRSCEHNTTVILDIKLEVTRNAGTVKEG